MSKLASAFLGAAPGLQRGETISAFRARMEGLARLEADIRAGVLSGADAASRLHELMLPDSEASCDSTRFDRPAGGDG